MLCSLISKLNIKGVFFTCLLAPFALKSVNNYPKADTSKPQTSGSRRNPHSSLFVGCLTSQQQASVSQGRICSDKCTCCHTEIEVAHQTFFLTQSQYTDARPTSPTADPIIPGAWQGRQCGANFEVTGMTRPGKIPSQAGFEPRIFRSRGGRLNH